uniref:Uncharacterized protein n=1 Tax=Panagrolaimus sp. JU765 TaxID=591449 RepID=A0AC34R3Z4_9BILA
MALIIRKATPQGDWANVYEVIRYRVFTALQSVEELTMDQIFPCPYPVPAVAYAYYMIERGDVEELNWLKEAQENIAKNRNYMEIWTKTVSTAAKGSLSLLEDIDKWDKMNANNPVPKTDVGKTRKKARLTQPTQNSDEEGTYKKAES